MNKVILIGHVGKDADCTPVNATDVSKFSLATSESYLDKQGNRITNTEWHNITCWGGLAKIAYKYVKKGAHVAIEGSIHNRSYEKDGIKRYYTEITASDIKLLDKKPESATSAPGPASPQQAPQNDFAAPVDDDLPF